MIEKGAVHVVTGGAGFIGSHLVERLVGEGGRVRVLDNLSTGRAENLGFARGLPDGAFELIEADIMDVEGLRRAMRGAAVVFHEAALPSVPRSIRNPMESHRVNATGTLAALVAAHEASVRRFVYASSSSVYGDTEVLPKVEAMAPRPMSPYAVAKLTGEQYCRAFHRVHGLGTVALRYFNVFGPRQDPTSEYAAVIPRFISILQRGESPVIYGDGQQSRDFTYVADAVEANLRAIRAGDGAMGEVFNAAAGRRVSLLELLEMLGRIVGREPAPRFEPPRAGDVRHSQADPGRALALLGWSARVGMEEGLRRTVAWMGEAGAT